MVARKTELSTNKVLKMKYDDLLAEKAEIEAKSAPLREQREKLNVEYEQFYQSKIQPLTDKINEIERPRLIEVQEEISKMARVMGGRSMGEGQTRESEPVA